MSNPNQNFTNPGASGQQKPSYFSRKAILVFTVFFSAIAGGLLLRQNLLDSGNKADANKVMLISIGLVLIQYFLGSNVSTPAGKGITFWIGIIGMYLLYKNLSPKYVKDEASYDKKSVWKQSIIAFIITSIIIYVMLKVQYS